MSTIKDENETIRQSLINIIADGNKMSTIEISQKLNIPINSLLGRLRALESMKKVALEPEKIQVMILLPEGEQYAEMGLPEKRLYQILNDTHPKTRDELVEYFDGADLEIGIQQGLASRNITRDKATNKYSCVSSPTWKNEEKALQYLRKAVPCNVVEGIVIDAAVENTKLFDASTIADLKKRKLINHRIATVYTVKAIDLKSPCAVQLTDITENMIIGGFDEKKLKAYNFDAEGKKPVGGSIHPLTGVASAIHTIMKSLQFEEMDTRSHVEGSMWCFDALYIPQSHPARDIQDTFFLKEPKDMKAESVAATYRENIRKIHEVGIGSSIGWRCGWDLGVALKNVMRTHTTPKSAHYLYEMAQTYKKDGIVPNRRLYSVDRVFRNEAIDATHLAEFHQIEGLVIGPGLSLGNLKSCMRAFYTQMGISDIKFKPTFNPYTEPSMEIFGYHIELKKWIEVGNSGVFRPEMLVAMGFDEDTRVIAWGLSLERAAMLHTGIGNIRQLLGPKADLGRP